MLISKAYAQSVEIADSVTSAAPQAPDMASSFAWNIGLVLVLVVLFYVLLIAPQQRRFKEHSQMLAALKKGDRVITGGGLVGKIEKLIDDQEVLVDLGNGLKVTALRSTLQNGSDVRLDAKNDNKNDKSKEKDAKKK